MTPRVRLLLAIAGLVTVLAFLFQPLLEESDVAPADPSIAGGDAALAPRALTPVGEIPRSPARFVWTSDPLAAQYRFELRGTRGAVLHQAVVTDTMLVIPSGLVDWNITAGGTWQVTSNRRDGREAARAPVAFRIASP